MNTNTKGDIALSRVMADLIERGHDVFLPVNDHPKADLITIVGGKPLKVQVKYCSDGQIRNESVSIKTNGISRSKYTNEEVDCFGVYLAQIKTVVYIPFEHGGIKVRWISPKNNQKCWWYEDFLTLDFSVEKQQKRV